MSDEQNSNNEAEEPQESQEQSQEVSEAPGSTEKFDINTVIQDALKVITDPIGFYREMPTTGGYTNPLIFVLVMAVAAAAVGFVLNLIGLAKYNPVVAGGAGFWAIFVFPIIMAIASFIGAAIMFVIWKLMGSERDYETAYRCTAYSTAVMPVVSAVSFLPYIATIVRAVWSIFLFYIASTEVHKIKESTAKIVFGILAVLMILSGIKGERDYRKFSNYVDRIEREYKHGSIGKAVEELENVEDMTPEEAGKKFGEFLKGMEEFSKGLEESVKEEEEKQKSND